MVISMWWMAIQIILTTLHKAVWKHSIPYSVNYLLSILEPEKTTLTVYSKYLFIKHCNEVCIN